MRKFNLLLVMLLCAMSFGFSQNRVVITENFDGSSCSFTLSPSSNWSRDTVLSAGGRKSAWGMVPNAAGDSIELISPIYDLSNYAYAYLRFSHICKVSDLDAVSIEYKEDYMGAKWQKIPSYDYKGSSQTYKKQSCFHQGSYGVWVKNDLMAKPDNSWWRTESFDVSQDVAYAKVQFKFKVKKGSTVGTNFAWGWFIDNFELTCATTQINPPVVEFVRPYTEGLVYGTGPYTIYAKAAKRTLLPLKTPILRVTYTPMKGLPVADSIVMKPFEGDSIWYAVIPQQNVGTQVAYTVYATDTVGNNQSASSGYTIGREWGFDSNCVAILSIDSPVVGALAGTATKVYATIENRGLTDLTSAQLDWYVNNVKQTPVKWTGKLPEGFSGQVYLGSYVPMANSVDTIVATVSAPNGNTGNNTVDTAVSKAVYSCASILSGKYAVGATGTFKTINEALDIIRTCGISGDVTLEMQPGTYMEHVEISDMLASFSGTYGLTITSATGKAEDVIFDCGMADEVVMINNMRNLTLSHLTFVGKSDGISMQDSIYNVEISNCRVLLDTTTTTGTWGIGNYSGPSINKVRILNNEIIGAYYSIYLYGSSKTQKLMNATVIGNRMHAAYYYGLYTYYTDFDYIRENTVTNRVKDGATYFYGLRLYYSEADEVSKNRLNAKTNYVYGMYTYYYNQDSTRAGLIDNNELIYAANTTSYGCYIYYSNVEYTHNTVISYGSNTSADYGVYYGASAGYRVNLYNNNFVCYSKNAYPIYMTGTATVGTDLLMDNNNCWAPQYVGYAGGARNNLNDWMTYSKDAHALNVEPLFIDRTKSAQCVHYTGLTCPAVSNVPVDIRDSVRAGSTAVGCYTSTPVDFDAMLAGFSDWQTSVIIGQATPVKVRLMNVGSSTNITSATINWTANGVAQTAFNWTGNLKPYDETVVAIGDYKPIDGVNSIVVWLSKPNGQTHDSLATNDTIRNNSYGCKSAMSGSYLVGNSKNADFADMDQAVKMLSSCGVGGPVEFRLDSGVYDPIEFSTTYNGMSPVNTVTITSASGKASDVVITGGAALVTFNGASHFRLENVTLDGYGSTYGVYINGTLSDIQVKHCVINMNPTTSSTQYGIYCASGFKRDSIYIIGNRIDGGYYGIYFYGGTSSTNTDHGRFNRIDSNTITNPYYYSSYVYYADLLSYSYNTCIARQSGGYNYFYGLHSYYGNIDKVIGNHVDGLRDFTAYSYGIYVYYSNYTYAQSTKDTTIFANNEVRVKASTTVYGLYVPYGRNKVINNSVYAVTASGGYGIYAYSTSTGYCHQVDNNNVVMIGGTTSAYPIYTYTSPTYATLSNNNYWHDNIASLLYRGGACATLSAVQQYDTKAVSVMPEFVDYTVGLFMRKSVNTTMNCPLSRYATVDINGDKRTDPTVRGCYNPVDLPYNAALKNFVDPAVNVCKPNDMVNVSVTLLNRADSAMTSATIYWSVNGVMQTPYNWTGNLSSDQTELVKLGSFAAKVNSNTIKAFVHLNGHTDALSNDDTIYTSVFGCPTGALVGKYTVGTPTSDFPTLSDAIIALTNCGVAGPVEMLLASGTYDEIDIAGAFPGGSYTNRVVFTSATGNKADVVILPSTTSDACHLTDVADLHFRHVTIGDTVSTEKAVKLSGTIKNVHFYDCNLYCALGATSSSYTTVYRDASAVQVVDSLKLIKCNIRGGYYNVYMINAGTSSSVYGNMTMDSCNLLDAYYSGYFGTYPVYNILTARHNYIHNASNSSTYYGIRLGNMTSYQSIDSLKGNRIWCNASGTNYGVYVGQTVNYNGIGQLSARIWNNEIVVERGSTNYGFYYGNMSYMDWSHNTIYVSGSGTHYGIYNTNTSVYRFECYDNLIYVAGTQGTAACFEHSGGTGYLAPNYMNMDYNVYYNEVNGTIGNGITDTKTWSATINNDFNALYEKVYFKDLTNYNFHTSGARAIIPVDARVLIDMNGKPRLSYTNAGCYNDFIPSNYDAGVTVITSPVNGEIAGQTATCKVKVRNMGKVALNDVVINWTVNGVAQTPYKWAAKTMADTITYGGVTPELSIGTFTVPVGKYDVVAWTEMPNGFADLNKDNDTAYTNVISCSAPLAGTYVIGGANADFDTPEDAATALVSCGIKGSVIMKFASGDYKSFAIMGIIPGASDSSTVTFTSLANNADAVVIGEGEATALKLNNTSHLVFEKLTIGGTTSANKVAVNFGGYIEDVFFHNCNMVVNVASSNTADRVVEYANSSSTTNYMKDVRFIGNDIRGGYYGFYLYYAGGNAANCKTSAVNRANIIMDSNYIYDQYYYPVYSYYYTHIQSFSHNTIRSRNGASYNYGVYFYYYNLIDSVIGNRIYNYANYAYSAIRLYYYINQTSTFGTDITPAIVSNNEIVCKGSTYAYGIYTYYAHAAIVNNSIYCNAPTNYGMYIGTSGSVYDLNIQNNILVSEGGATTNYLIYCTAAATLTTYPTLFDYNDYYTTGTNKNNFYDGSAAMNFAKWQSTYNMDGHSVEVMPDFVNLPNDLSIGDFDALLKCNRHRAVPRDINNDARTTLTMMGCYSTPLFEGNDLQAEVFVEPVVGGIQCFPDRTPVKLCLYNMGTKAADFSTKPMTLYLKCESDSVNFTSNVTVNSGSISIMKRDTFELVPNMDITYPGLYKLTAWVDWGMDELADDDTLRLDYYVDKTVLPYDNDFTGTFAGVATNQAYGDISWEVTNSNPVLNPVFGTGSLLFGSSKERGSISHALFTSVSLQGTYNPQLYFWYAHDDKNPYLRDQMEVRISQDGGATFKTLQTLYRYDAKCSTPTWKEYKIDLSNYRSGSCIIIAFTAYSYGGGDQTVDRVKIIAQQDMQVLVEAPSDTDFAACNLTGRNLTVYLENLTSQEVPFNPGDSITVEMSGASNFIFKQALSGRLENKETDTLEVGPIDYIGGGQFDVKVYVNSIDSNASNDTAKFSLNLNPDLSIISADAIGLTQPGDTLYASFTLKNVGNLDIISPFDVRLVVNGEDTITEQVTGALKVGDTLHYTFSQPYIVPATTSDQPFYLLDIAALMGCDANADNDSIQVIGNVDIVDNGILSITNPVSGKCSKGGEEIAVEVRLFNNGTVDGTDSLVLTAVIDSAGTAFQTIVEKIAPMYAGENRNHVFTHKYSVPRLSVNGTQETYKVVVYLAASEGDIDKSNDTASVESCVEGGVGIAEAAADRWSMGQNQPNPATNVTKVPFTLPEAGTVIFNVMGLNGQVLYREEVSAEAGQNELQVSTSDYAAGIYYYSMEYKGQRLVRKMNIVR